jgi:signal transduction histidine kinase
VRSLARAFNEMAARLQAHEQQRRNLLAEVTHELRTPLAVIQGNLEGLLDGVYPRDDAHLTPILEEAQILATLIEDLRTLALAETGTLDLHREPTDLGALIEETLAAHRGRADASGVILDTQIAAALPLLDVDPTRIHQVVTNVLSNALRHTGPGGRISVVVGREPTAGAEERITLSVTDTGTGISAEDLPHVFDRFYRSPDSPGSGLGLAIAKNLVVLHGGEIRAESAPGAGTTVRITLPVPPRRDT